MAGTRPAFFVAVLLLATPATLNAAPTVDEKFPPDIERLLTLPEDQIDIGEAALIFARQAFPGKVDVTAYSRELDRLADEARQLVPSNAGSDEKVIALIDVIYKREGYRYDFSPGAWSKNANYFLPGILDTKQGACVNMPMLFMAVAQRLGLQIYPAHTPQHTFLRNTDPFAQYTNIEATGGGTKTDAHYIEEMHISQTAIDKGISCRLTGL